MEIKFNHSNISDINISFSLNQDKKSNEMSNDLLKNDYINNKNIKLKFPKNKIFRINSIIFNNDKNQEEIYTQYQCIYNEKDNSLYLFFNQKDNYTKFAKDKLLNILQFSMSIEISTIYLLINRKNNHYLNVIKDMIIVGFEPAENLPIITIEGNIYKILKMSIKDISQDIKEINII